MNEAIKQISEALDQQMKRSSYEWRDNQAASFVHCVGYILQPATCSFE